MVVPLGWLPLGVLSLAEGNYFVAVLGLLGMTLIGSASLFRAYRTTIGLYQGQFSGRKAGGPQPPRCPHLSKASAGCCSKPVFPVSLSRFPPSRLPAFARYSEPEAKMMLLSPVIMGFVFGSMLWQGPGFSELMRPLVAIGGMAFVLFGLVQLMANQFGFDRDGFRVFVLSAARRRDILMGKNLSFAHLLWAWPSSS